MRRDLALGVAFAIVLVVAGGYYFARESSQKSDLTAIEPSGLPLKAQTGDAAPAEQPPAPQQPVEEPKPVVDTTPLKPEPSHEAMTPEPQMVKSEAVEPAPAKTELPAAPPATQPVAAAPAESVPPEPKPVDKTPAMTETPPQQPAEKPVAEQPRPREVVVIPPSQDPQPPTAQPAATPDGSRIHVVEQGESLSQIAQRYYNDPMLYKLLMQVNPQIKNPHVLHAGMKLVIPDKPDKKQHDSAKSGAAASANPATAQQPPKAAAAPPGMYKVQHNDNLITIARKQLGDGRRWKEIYELNKSAIGPHVEDLRDGMLIKLPPRDKPGAAPASQPMSANKKSAKR